MISLVRKSPKYYIRHNGGGKQPTSHLSLVMETHGCSEKQAKQLIYKDVVENVTEFYRDGLVKYDQTKKDILDVLEHHDWNVDVYQLYERNPYYKL